MSDLTILISVDKQRLDLLQSGTSIRNWPISTALKGVGSQPNSNRTPTGRHSICEMIGEGMPSNTQFVGRLPAGTWDGLECPDDLILSRILWLDGMEKDNQNTRERFIYIHGTNHEKHLGTPVSCGCVRMSRIHVTELYDLVSPGTEVVIEEPHEPRENLIFFDCDSTVSKIEGIDELARESGPQVFAQVEALTNAAMNGEVPLDDVFSRRMQMIQPHKDLCDKVARKYIETQTEGVAGIFKKIKDAGWTPVILSGGFAPIIKPLADTLGVKHIEAVPLFFDSDDCYVGYDKDYPTTRNGGKPEIIKQWKDALLSRKIIMVGDGISDLETKEICDVFIGFGGVIQRPAVKDGANYWITSFEQFPLDLLS